MVRIKSIFILKKLVLIFVLTKKGKKNKKKGKKNDQGLKKYPRKIN